jgi:AraC-like DNA-binding protein
MRWLADARIDRARELLETTSEPVENIGHLTGLGAPASVRAAFHRHIGTSPQEYRSLFGHGTDDHVIPPGASECPIQRARGRAAEGAHSRRRSRWSL